jgi:hypothetical protein
MKINTDYIVVRIAQLQESYNNSLLKSEQIKGALQEALFTQQKLNEIEQKEIEPGEIIL